MRPFVNVALILLLVVGSTAARAQPSERLTYRGPCDASAAVALDADHFVVGNDEDAVLRVYRRGRAAPLGPGLDVSRFLGVSPDDEVDNLLIGRATPLPR